ncbi:MAG: FAD-dependent oxidoreductase [Coriobacteriia bacterium]|nr:FAD-dependent oxidoreductase [Coriobacteriia bacterium]MBN2822192.1 FAD-dependent oxidoreductase [Coriobacteriia bacterium]
MAIYPVRLLGSQVCEGTVGIFRFQRPAGYSFLPGQHFSLRLETPQGPVHKVFTISSAPFDDHLEICTRQTGSAFKVALFALSQGDAAEVTSATGHLALAGSDCTTAFLVGGVGVTPAHSMVRDALVQGRRERVVLFYGDRSPGCMAYADGFRAIAGRTRRLLYVPVVETAEEGWNGEVGFITADLVSRHIDPSGVSTWIVAGPPVMVDAMRTVIDDLGVSPGRVQVESFTGYQPHQ